MKHDQRDIQHANILRYEEFEINSPQGLQAGLLLEHVAMKNADPESFQAEAPWYPFIHSKYRINKYDARL